MVILILSFNRKIPVIMARTMFAPGILWACGVKLKVIGADQLDSDQPYVFASNHLSYLDIPVLFAAIPHNLHFVAKKQIKSVPFVGWYMMATGMIFVDRSDRSKAKASMQKAGSLIKSGKDVLMFPEGTRSRNGKVSSFKKGAFILAQSAKVPVVPVAISGTERAMQVKKWTIIPSTIGVHIGTPIAGNDLEFNDYANRCKTEVQSLHSSLIHQLA